MSTAGYIICAFRWPMCLAGLLVLAGTSLVAEESSSATAHTLLVDGAERHYLLVSPKPQDSAEKFPLVFVFHGANNDGALMDRVTGFTQLAEKKRFMVVYPDGWGKRWNGLNSSAPPGNAAKHDDIAFISDLLDDLEAHYRIDPQRIYAAGSSNGAIFCHTLAARLSTRIAAIGAVSGNLVELIPKKFPPTSAVSVILFNGTDDPLVRFSGEPGRDGTGLMSVANTIAFWIGVDRCESQPSVSTLPRAEPDEGTTVVKLYYSKKGSAAEVVAYIVGHGGHTWPGTQTDPVWAKTAGKTTMAINATEAMWDFFAAHPKK